MNNPKRSFSLLIAVFFMFTLSMNAFAQKGPKNNILDGKTFTIELKLENVKKPKPPIPDEISFKSAKFSSKLFAKDMFKGTVYDVEVDSSGVNKTYSFEVEIKNDKEDVLKWEGFIEMGDEEAEIIEGQCEVTNKKGKLLERYSYEGKQKLKKKR